MTGDHLATTAISSSSSTSSPVQRPSASSRSSQLLTASSTADPSSSSESESSYQYFKKQHGGSGSGKNPDSSFGTSGWGTRGAQWPDGEDTQHQEKEGGASRSTLAEDFRSLPPQSLLQHQLFLALKRKEGLLVDVQQVIVAISQVSDVLKGVLLLLMVFSQLALASTAPQTRLQHPVCLFLCNLAAALCGTGLMAVFGFRLHWRWLRDWPEDATSKEWLKLLMEACGPLASAWFCNFAQRFAASTSSSAGSSSSSAIAGNNSSSSSSSTSDFFNFNFGLEDSTARLFMDLGQSARVDSFLGSGPDVMVACSVNSLVLLALWKPLQTVLKQTSTLSVTLDSSSSEGGGGAGGGRMPRDLFVLALALSPLIFTQLEMPDCGDLRWLRHLTICQEVYVNPRGRTLPALPYLTPFALGILLSACWDRLYATMKPVFFTDCRRIYRQDSSGRQPRYNSQEGERDDDDNNGNNDDSDSRRGVGDEDCRWQLQQQHQQQQEQLRQQQSEQHLREEQGGTCYGALHLIPWGTASSLLAWTWGIALILMLPFAPLGQLWFALDFNAASQHGTQPQHNNMLLSIVGGPGRPSVVWLLGTLWPLAVLLAILALSWSQVRRLEEHEEAQHRRSGWWLSLPMQELQHFGSCLLYYVTFSNVFLASVGVERVVPSSTGIQPADGHPKEAFSTARVMIGGVGILLTARFLYLVATRRR